MLPYHCANTFKCRTSDCIRVNVSATIQHKPLEGQGLLILRAQHRASDVKRHSSIHRITCAKKKHWKYFTELPGCPQAAEISCLSTPLLFQHPLLHLEVGPFGQPLLVLLVVCQQSINFTKMLNKVLADNFSEEAKLTSRDYYFEGETDLNPR